MKSIENSSVLNTWVLLVDFLNEHWFIAAATSTKILFIRAFMVSWRFCDTHNESAGHKEDFKTELPKLPCRKAKRKIFPTTTNLVSKHAKFNVDFENSGPFGKTSVREKKLRLV